MSLEPLKQKPDAASKPVDANPAPMGEEKPKTENP
jgi:hypothetical protein